MGTTYRSRCGCLRATEPDWVSFKGTREEFEILLEEWWENWTREVMEHEYICSEARR